MPTSHQQYPVYGLSLLDLGRTVDEHVYGYLVRAEISSHPYTHTHTSLHDYADTYYARLGEDNYRTFPMKAYWQS